MHAADWRTSAKTTALRSRIRPDIRDLEAFRGIQPAMVPEYPPLPPLPPRTDRHLGLIDTPESTRPEIRAMMEFTNSQARIQATHNHENTHMTQRCPHDVILPDEKNRRFLYAFFKRVREAGKTFLMQSDVETLLDETTQGTGIQLADDSEIRKILASTMNAAFDDPWLAVELRPAIGRWCSGRFHLDQLSYEGITTAELMRFREHLIDGHDDHADLKVEYDSTAFLNDIPLMKDRKHIGRGVEYLNRTLSSRLFADPGQRSRTLLDFLRLHQHQGLQLMLANRIAQPADLRIALDEADSLLADLPKDTPWEELRTSFATLGLEPGWGDTAGRCRETISLLTEILDAPDAAGIEAFLSRVPMIFSVVIFSPHGYFGQSKVLGLPRSEERRVGKEC